MDAQAYLNSLQPLAMRFGLERMERGLAALGHPERRYPVLHVAGTNGKGSTCAMAAEALRAGRPPGRALHLAAPGALQRADRGRRRGHRRRPAGRARSRRFAAPVPGTKPGARTIGSPTSSSPRCSGCSSSPIATSSVAVVEVGLGGRFDATNAIAAPAVTAVARIGLDHTQLLGDTVEAIAREKAGIFKPGRPGGGAPRPARRRARGASVGGRPPRGSFHVAPAGWDGPMGWPGPHQRGNAALAAAALRALAGRGVAARRGATSPGGSPAPPGRGAWRRWAACVLDGAHNPQGAAALAEALAALYPGRAVELVFGVLSDKDHAGMLAAVRPAVRRVHVVAPADAARPGRRRRWRRSLARSASTPIVHGDLEEALACARRAASGERAGVHRRIALPGRRGAVTARGEVGRYHPTRLSGFLGACAPRAILRPTCQRSPPMRARLLPLLAVAVAAPAWAAELNVITSVEVKDTGPEVVLSVKGSRKPSFTTFSMADPPRFVIDFSESKFQGVAGGDARRRRRRQDRSRRCRTARMRAPSRAS